ncbi:MAG: hypothetical protein Q9181_001329 [Wetmoreana brouardii]
MPAKEEIDEVVHETSAPVQLPRITITFCTQCKWMLRAAYYAQELLSTFSTSLGEVALVPATGGIFTVHVFHLALSTSAAEANSQNDPKAPGRWLEPRRTQLWDRNSEGGFPETKQLKRLVRDIIAPGRDLGHVDRHSSSKGKEADSSNANNQDSSQASSSNTVLASSKNDEYQDRSNPPAPLDSAAGRKGVDRNAIPTPAETATAEKMVVDIMSSFRTDRLKDNDSETPHNQHHQQREPSAERSITEKAEKVVTNVVSSFRQTLKKADDVGEIGGGSEGMGTGQEGKESDDQSDGEGEEEGERGVRFLSGRQGCEDCA